MRGKWIDRGRDINQRLVEIEGGAALSDCLKYHSLEQNSSACKSIQKDLSHSENTSGTD